MDELPFKIVKLLGPRDEVIARVCLMRQPQELRSHMEKPIKLNMEAPDVPRVLELVRAWLVRSGASRVCTATTTHSRTKITHRTSGSSEAKARAVRSPLEYSYFQSVAVPIGRGEGGEPQRTARQTTQDHPSSNRWQ